MTTFAVEMTVANNGSDDILGVTECYLCFGDKNTPGAPQTTLRVGTYDGSNVTNSRVKNQETCNNFVNVSNPKNFINTQTISLPEGGQNIPITFSTYDGVRALDAAFADLLTTALSGGITTLIGGLTAGIGSTTVAQLVNKLATGALSGAEKNLLSNLSDTIKQGVEELVGIGVISQVQNGPNPMIISIYSIAEVDKTIASNITQPVIMQGALVATVRLTPQA
jgi:hypothetical protein